MPELPEVESVVRTLRDDVPALPGRVVRGVLSVRSSQLCGVTTQDFGNMLAGLVFTSVSRYGKYLVIGLKRSVSGVEELFLVIHLRMTGRLFLLPRDRALERHTALALLLDDELVLRFDDPRKFGRVWLLDDPAELFGGLGPDALNVSFVDFRAAITGLKRQIKPLLLDQSFLAGIGNIYADESLFRAGIHPLTISRELREDELVRLHGSIRQVLSEAVEKGGANVDGVFKEGGFLVSVYGRGGLPCPQCSAVISKIRVGQRGTHFCPVCQPIKRDSPA